MARSLSRSVMYSWTLALLLGSSIAWAEVPPSTHPLVVNGTGIRKATIFGIKVYRATLSLPSPSSDPDQILKSKGRKKLVLEFVRDLSNEKIHDAWSEGMKKNVENHDRFKNEVGQVSRYFGEVKEGDSFEFIFDPNVLTVKGQGREPLEVKAPEIDEAFLSIWLGANPPDAGLKEGLLGRSGRLANFGASSATYLEVQHITIM